MSTPGGPVIGIDIGTSSSKAVMVDPDGTIIAQARHPHDTDSPAPGHFQHDPENIWWQDVVELLAELSTAVNVSRARAVCLSGIGPAVLLADDNDIPLHPAILYGIDTRANLEISELTTEIGVAKLLERTGNTLSSQSVGPKIRWLRRHHPEVLAHARRYFTAQSYLVHRLTGEYILDHYSAGATDPLYDLAATNWWDDQWQYIAPELQLPRLLRPGDIAGVVTAKASAATGLTPGLPVLAGTIDALAEAISVGVRKPGDCMVMYGSTLFIVQVTESPFRHPALFATEGERPENWTAAAGMSTAGLAAQWFSSVCEVDIGSLHDEAAKVAHGSNGLVFLPYLAGERTPILDPQASGVWVGLTLRHGRGHLYRSILEGVGYGVRHNLAEMALAGAVPQRLVAVGGGATSDLWPQIVSDITGVPQQLPSITTGASYGDARLAAEVCGVSTTEWNPALRTLQPNASTAGLYLGQYEVYRASYQQLTDQLHQLAQAPPPP